MLAHAAVGGPNQVVSASGSPRQRMSLAEVVVGVQPGEDPGKQLARLVHARQLRHDIGQGFHALVRAQERGFSQRVPKHTGGDRVTLVLVGIQKAFGRGPVDRLGQLPSQVHGILHTQAEALSTRRVIQIDPHRQPGDPGGHDPLDLVLPDPRASTDDVSGSRSCPTRSCRRSAPGQPDPRRGTDQRPRADPAPRSCASESRRPVSRRARDRDAARRPRRRPPPTPTQPPTSSPSALLRRSPPRARLIAILPSDTSTTTHAFRDSHLHRLWSRPAVIQHDPGLHEGPV
jgi:hypothetical protein